VKFNTSRSWKAKDQENGQSYGLDVDPKFFYDIGFSILMAQDEILPHMSTDHGPWVVDDENHVMVSNHNKNDFNNYTNDEASCYMSLKLELRTNNYNLGC
jgi:hypothetical protein